MFRKIVMNSNVLERDRSRAKRISFTLERESPSNLLIRGGFTSSAEPGSGSTDDDPTLGSHLAPRAGFASLSDRRR